MYSKIDKATVYGWCGQEWLKIWVGCWFNLTRADQWIITIMHLSKSF